MTAEMLRSLGAGGLDEGLGGCCRASMRPRSNDRGNDGMVSDSDHF